MVWLSSIFAAALCYLRFPVNFHSFFLRIGSNTANAGYLATQAIGMPLSRLSKSVCLSTGSEPLLALAL